MENLLKRMVYTSVGVASKTANQLQQSENEWAIRGEKELETMKWSFLQSTENALIKMGILQAEQMPDVNTWGE
jgi:hypothetical protein